MGLMDNTIKTTKANTVNNSNRLHLIEFHSPTARLIFLCGLITLVLFLCCKIPWQKMWKNHHQCPDGTTTSTYDPTSQPWEPAAAAAAAPVPTYPGPRSSYMSAQQNPTAAMRYNRPGIYQYPARPNTSTYAMLQAMQQQKASSFA